MYAISYFIIFAFHPKLHIERIGILRSFCLSLDQLTDVIYLNPDMFKNLDQVTTNQLKDCAINVSEKSKYAISEMCSNTLKFASDCLKKWFSRKYKKMFLEIDVLSKKKFEEEHPIDWYNGKCVICNFLLVLGIADFQHSNEKMTYYDFIIRKEHKFLRNVYSPEDL